MRFEYVPGYRIAVLVHKNEELTDEVNWEGVGCTDYNHPRYEEARRVDDERCEECARRHTPPNLTLIQGGKA